MTVAQQRLEHVLFARFDRHSACEVVLVGGKRHGARKTSAPLQRQTDASKSSSSRSDLYWPEISKASSSHRVTCAGDSCGRRSPCLMKAQYASNWLCRSPLATPIARGCTATARCSSGSARAAIAKICIASRHSGTTTDHSTTATSSSGRARTRDRSG